MGSHGQDHCLGLEDIKIPGPSVHTHGADDAVILLKQFCDHDLLHRLDTRFSDVVGKNSFQDSAVFHHEPPGSGLAQGHASPVGSIRLPVELEAPSLHDLDHGTDHPGKGLLHQGGADTPSRPGVIGGRRFVTVPVRSRVEVSTKVVLPGTCAAATDKGAFVHDDNPRSLFPCPEGCKTTGGTGAEDQDVGLHGDFIDVLFRHFGLLT